MVNSSPARRASSGRGVPLSPSSAVTTTRRRLATMTSNWSPRAWPRLSLTDLEAVEVDEQHRRLGVAGAGCQHLVGFGAEMEAVRQRRDRVVHAQRMRILDRRADLGEQAVDRGGQLRAWYPCTIAGAGLVRSPLLDREQPVAKRGQGAGAFAVRPFGGDVADQQAEGAGDDRGQDLLVEFGDVEECRQRKDERRKAGRARKDGVADLLRRAVFHLGCDRPEQTGIAAIRSRLNGQG